MPCTRDRRALTLDRNIKNETSGGMNPKGMPISIPMTPAASEEPPEEPIIKPMIPPTIAAMKAETKAAKVANQKGFQYSSDMAYPSEAKNAKKKCKSPLKQDSYSPCCNLFAFFRALSLACEIKLFIVGHAMLPLPLGNLS